MSGCDEILPGLWECGHCRQLTHESHFYEDRATGLMAHELDPTRRQTASDRCGWRCNYDPSVERCVLPHGHDGKHSVGIHGYGPFTSRSYGAVAPASTSRDECEPMSAKHSPAPGPTAMDPGGSEGMVTDPPAVTIPEERAYLIFDPEDGEVFGAEDENLSTFAVSRERALGMAAEYRSAVDAGLMDWHVVRLVTADEWDAICADRDRLRAEVARLATRLADARDADAATHDWINQGGRIT